LQHGAGIGLMLTLKANGDIEVLMPPDIALKVAAAIDEAARDSEIHNQPGGQERRLFGSFTARAGGRQPESLVHDVTLLPRHVSSRCVTHPLGIRCYLSLRNDS
jgi:hypothetical protein